MPKPVSPETKILVAARNAIAVSSVRVDFDIPDLIVRHTRHRTPRSSEANCISVRLVDAAINDEAGEMYTTDEVPWRMMLDIIVDLELSPEPDAVDQVHDDDNDVTGFDVLSAMARYAANELINPDPAAPMRQVVDDIVPGDIDPDEESQPDKGRLVISVVVLYRTRYDDLLTLLGPSENA